MHGALPRYRHRVVTETGLEVLEIDLIVAESFFSDEIKALETLCRQARRHLQENLGINAQDYFERIILSCGATSS